VEVEWDGRKAEANLRKHGVMFADAMAVFEDVMALVAEDRRSAEWRQVVTGRDALRRILVVVYTWRGNNVRLISARKATTRERRAYQGG